MSRLSSIKNGFKLFKAQKNLKNPDRKELAKAQIKKIFEGERGLLLKIGQFLGMKEEYGEILEISSDISAPVDKDLLKSKFHEIYNEDFDFHYRFSSLDPSSASLSQVFYLEEKSSKKIHVAKMQIPGIKEEVEKQLSLLGMIPGVGPAKKWGLDIDGYKSMLHALLEDELDYGHEIGSLSLLSPVFKNNKFIHIPEVHLKFQSSQLYFQSYASGTDLSRLVNESSLSNSDKTEIVDRILEFHLSCLVEGHCLQTDGNYGNFRLEKKEGRWHLNPIDFGALRTHSSDFTWALIRLYLSSKKSGEENLMSLMIALGFDKKKLQLIDWALPKLLGIFSEPLVSEKPYNLKTWNLNERLDSLLGDQKWWFRSAGGNDFFLLMKCLNSLFALCRIWNLNYCFSEKIDRIISSKILTAVQWQPPVLSEDESSPSFSLLAKEVKVTVRENGKTKVKLSMPIRAMDRLKEYMDEELLKKLEEKQISIDEKVNIFIKSGGIPAVIFHLEEGDKEYIVEAV